MTPEEALRLIEQGEGQRVEFKASFAEENKAIESLCAFTHADGGTVFFGVAPDGRIVGVSLGHNTLENFANKLKANSQPPLTPAIHQLTVDDNEVVAVTIDKAGIGQVFFAFGRPLIRVGKTNQAMSPEQVRAKLMEGQIYSSEERDRPRFEALRQGVKGTEAAFVPEFKLKHVLGDPVANLQWRFRGPRFFMEWRAASGSALDRTKLSGQFDLSGAPQEDDLVGVDEMGLEIRFHWRGQWRHELHRWPISRRQLPQKTLWDVHEERLPPVYLEGAE